ncbi:MULTISPECIES: ExbD/TolR family protein [Pseudanabaena]|uniref:Outer membrane transport energization protein ExbD n=2 Tax=Pseudanabaena TaxID=1152 RepID=L8N3L8_9CYAN|nr:MULTISPECIES: biopolymer transporter ExbD [Pseudanabaena]ELS33295.1 outer membrane transport energization protein ExbD [Pseudanabaena biceps PCC 7429]MDG3494477.1 biopolymer transporter ExbD [Pseudanabaena catenata USMAC16]
MSRRNRRRQDADLSDQPIEIKNVVPLLDVLFALLTFFVLSSLFLNRTEGLPVNLPKAQSGAMQKTPARATISVNEKTEVFLNKQKIGISEVSDRVKQLLEPNQDLVVVLNADRTVQHGDIIQIMDQLKQIPRVKMAIATKNN